MLKKLSYISTIFLSAFLLFQVQPIIAKILLPWFGGAAAVWITCMLFFQVVLLAGYIYAHILISRLKPALQKWVHTSLVVLSAFVLPIAPGRQLLDAAGREPIVHLLYVLLVSVGFPYFLLSTTSPLLQSWYSRTYSNVLPYRLFALSNLASLLGLLAYPFLVEPQLTLTQQSDWWSGAYIAFAAACVLTALYGAKTGPGECPDNTEAAGAAACDASPPPQMAEKALWLALAACASVLLLATTNYLTQNIASIPFLWILPLSLYLLTFTFCFDRSGWYKREWYIWIVTSFLGGMSYALLQWGEGYSIAVKIPFFSAGLFFCCMFCHGELAARKPAPQHLTSFYLMIATGGALGGILVGIAAPRMLSGPFELAIAMTICAVLLFIVNFRTKLLARAALSVLVISAAVTAVSYIYSITHDSLLLKRNFYGFLKVAEYKQGTPGVYRSLMHGSIIHGIQLRDPDRRREPVSYYSPGSGIGRAIKNLQDGPRRVGVIGLGAGALLSYAREGDYYHFYEINPLVESVARQEFSFISDCPGKVEISIGDGRLLLERENCAPYDLLAVDAFSGDSIPVHLLTVEAVQLYFSRLAPGGILALHISNHHLDLIPIVEQIRSTLGLKAVLISAPGRDDKQIFGSDWVLMTADRDLAAIPEIGGVAQALKTKPGISLWTDDYSNLVQIVKYKLPSFK
ncbi:MAG: fused MFS/spermidine synthase [Syntrophaceae bacterium]